MIIKFLDRHGTFAVYNILDRYIWFGSIPVTVVIAKWIDHSDGDLTARVAVLFQTGY